MKIYNFIKVMAIVVISCLFLTCVREKGEHEFITFVNHTEDTLYITKTCRIKIEPSDTLCDCNCGFITVLKGDTCQLLPSNHYWETDFKLIPYIQFFVFPASIFTYSEGTREYTYPSFCEETVKYQLKRYQLTEADLDSLNWTITYP